MQPSFRRAWGAFALAAALSLAGCSDERGPWPDEAPDVIDVKLSPGVTQAPAELTATAKVEPGKIRFPRTAAADAVAAWPVGKPILGGASTNGGNPVGFLRKVKSVNSEGGDVVVETEPATLQDVFTGKVNVNIPLDKAETLVMTPEEEARYFPYLEPGDGLPLPGQGQPLVVEPHDVGQFTEALSGSVEVTQVFDREDTWPVFSISKDRTYGSGSKQVTVNFQGGAQVTTKLEFSPTLRLAFEAGLTSGLDYFNVEANGPFKLTSTLDVNVGVTAAGGSKPTDMVDLDELVANGPETGKLPPVRLAKAGPKKGPVIAGVPTTFLLELWLQCSWGIQAGAHAKAEASVYMDKLRAGILYTDDGGWRTVQDFDMGKTATAQLLFGGGVKVECSLIPQINWLVADMGGPYLCLRNTVTAKATYVESCVDTAPYSGRPDGQVNADVDANFKLQVGGKVDAWKIVKFEKGPYTLYEKGWDDIWTGEKKFPGGGFGWCIVDCDNKLLSGEESDLDCGGPNCRRCLKDQKCKANADCLSGGCRPDGTCAASTCEDQQIGQDETDVDCGGKYCARCLSGRTCKANSDCDYGWCSDARYGPRVCTGNWCLDGILSGGESDVDCGWVLGCENLCGLGQNCRSKDDCASNSCHFNTHKCVASDCEDGRRGPDEGDVDCGGPCATKCALGATCAPWRGGGDCASGICAASQKCVGDLHEDGFTNAGETGPDCGGAAPARCGFGGGCESDGDCNPGELVCHPRFKICVRPGCDDAVKNGQESSVDCGGPQCAKCALSKSCNTGDDCVSGVCAGGRCVGSACENGVKDAQESDVDCGATCPASLCATGRACGANGDCASGICSDGRCTSDRCKDRVRNGDEVDVDCGGSCSQKCARGRQCLAGTDCQSGSCNATTSTCAGSICENGVKDEGEVDVDCGGTCTQKCAVNRACTKSADCASGTCNLVRGLCVPDACFDGVKNGSETDLDCGGSCPAKCGAGLSCSVARDCRSGACQAGAFVCAPDQCSDARLDNDETDVDCGGSCGTKCALGTGCLKGADCRHPQDLVGVDGYCSTSTHTCAQTSCTTGIKDGDETGVDCGGSCSQKCVNGEGCNANADCASNICNVFRHQCVATTCQDGVKNNGELDVDCGTAACGRNSCTLGKACTQSWDCNTTNANGLPGYIGNNKYMRCSDAGVCAEAYPMSCQEAWLINGPGDRSAGIKIIDPDGASQAPGHAVTNPIQVWCDQKSDGGWTPGMYLNSQTPFSMMADWRPGTEYINNVDPNRFTWEYATTHTGSCQTDADCSNACTTSTDVLYFGCPGSGTKAYCEENRCHYHATWRAMSGHPQNYSAAINGQTRHPASFLMNLNWFNIPGGAYSGDYGGGGLAVRWSQARWSVYRAGSLLYESPVFANEMRLPFGSIDIFSGNGLLYTPTQAGPWSVASRFNSFGFVYPSPRQNMWWMRTVQPHANGSYETGYPVGYPDKDTNGWKAQNVFFAMNVWGGANYTGPRSGFWIAGLNNQPGGIVMGSCNRFDSNCSNGISRTVSTSQVDVYAPNSNETSGNGSYGTELKDLAGLTFVLWVK